MFFTNSSLKKKLHGAEVYFLGTKNAQLFIGHQYFYMYEVSYQINRTTYVSK
jgi:hypothetical protein